MKSRSAPIASPASALWTMSPARSDCSTTSCTSASIRCAPVVAEHRDRLARQVGLVEHAGAQRVVDVVVDVGDAVEQPHDPSLQRARHRRAAGVAEDPVAHRLGQVEPLAVALQPLDDAQRVLVVLEAAAEALLQAVVERGLADVPERRVAEVVRRARSPRSGPR